MKNLIVIMYDSIANSIFEGQILAPLLKELDSNKELYIHLISFENKPIHTTMLDRIKSLHKRLHLHIYKKTKIFLGTFSLLLEQKKIKKILKQFDTYTLKARGPIAGALAQQSITPQCAELIIQARGLLAEEYQYSSKTNSNIIKKLISFMRYKQLYYFEKKVYEWLPPKKIIFSIESVSNALQNYIKTTYELKTVHITVASHDIPKTITFTEKQLWQNLKRKELGISKHAYVYVYNGSCKPWQCFRETVEFFNTILKKDTTAYLLVLSQDKEECLTILTQLQIPKNNFSLLYVPHNQLYTYLCAANTGIILREQHILNWVSRPTKILEYQATHLKIVHNNTIEYIEHLPQSYNLNDYNPLT